MPRPTFTASQAPPVRRCARRANRRCIAGLRQETWTCPHRRSCEYQVRPSRFPWNTVRRHELAHQRTTYALLALVSDALQRRHSRWSSLSSAYVEPLGVGTEQILAAVPKSSRVGATRRAALLRLRNLHSY